MLLGLDCGSTAIKAVLFGTDGTTLATGSRRTAPTQPSPGFVEQDMDRLWHAACAAIRDALERVTPDGETVDAIGVTAHGDGLYLCDAAGRPLGPGIQSVDSRAHAVTAEWASLGVLDAVEAITGQRPYPYAATTLLAWIKRHQPNRFAAIGHVLFCKDWLRYRLTGVLATDPTDASTAFTEAPTQHRSEVLLSMLGLESLASALPTILPSSGILGTVSAEAAEATGLKQGTPVSGGMHDVTASAVGLGNLEPGALSVTAGTFSINETLSNHLAVDRRWTARAGLRPGQWMNMFHFAGIVEQRGLVPAAGLWRRVERRGQRRAIALGDRRNRPRHPSGRGCAAVPSIPLRIALRHAGERRLLRAAVVAWPGRHAARRDRGRGVQSSVPRGRATLRISDRPGRHHWRRHVATSPGATLRRRAGPPGRRARSFRGRGLGRRVGGGSRCRGL